MFYSIITPTFRRHEEVSELLSSLVKQEYQNFEMIIVDNSPDDDLRSIVIPFQEKIRMTYIFEKGLGVSECRNLGVKHATGDYVIFIDSDCIIPPSYLKIVNAFLVQKRADAFGGPDRADKSFSRTQKAISYVMTSFYTTGGIRGRKNQGDQYQPRSYNMGVRREVFNELHGFMPIRVSEDIDLSMRIRKNGYTISFIEEAFVYHKRRATFGKFFKQVFSFGMGRYNLQKLHGDAVKPVHLLPTIFVLYLVTGIIVSFFSNGAFLVWIGSILAYITLVFMDSVLQNKDIMVGLLSIWATFVMLVGYGIGILNGMILKKG
jgi:glycosyltransferase involved in cell wall biosynthesis